MSRNPVLINNRYRVSRRLGGGSFGDIYLGVTANGERVAIKFEKHGVRCPQLRHEYKVYREMLGCLGFGRVFYFGTHENYHVMVMELLGPSLEDQFNKCGRRFSLRTVLQLADQMLERVETLHNCHLIHRDIKPANFVTGMVGGEHEGTTYCIDFGLSKRYRHPRTLQHIPHRDGRSLTGTPRYASINNHLGIEQSRRDDLESIGYVLVYFLKGGLPWQGLKARNAQKKYRLILEKKQSITIQQLCDGLPSQFSEYLAYTRSLRFDAKPNMTYLRGLFRDLFHQQGFASGPFEWDWDALDHPGPSPAPPPDPAPPRKREDRLPAAAAKDPPSPAPHRPDSAAHPRRPGTAAAHAAPEDLRSQDAGPGGRRPSAEEAKAVPGGAAAAAPAPAGGAPRLGGPAPAPRGLFRRSEGAAEGAAAAAAAASGGGPRAKGAAPRGAGQGADRRGTFSSWFGASAWGGRSGGGAQVWAEGGTSPSPGVVSGGGAELKAEASNSDAAQGGSSSVGRPSTAYGRSSGGTGNSATESSYAVASTRDMMRYRRSRRLQAGASSDGAKGSSAQPPRAAAPQALWAPPQKAPPQRPRSAYGAEGRGTPHYAMPIGHRSYGRGGSGAAAGPAYGRGTQGTSVGAYARGTQGASAGAYARGTQGTSVGGHPRYASSTQARSAAPARRPKTTGGRPSSAGSAYRAGAGYGAQGAYHRAPYGASYRAPGDGAAGGRAYGRERLGVQGGARGARRVRGAGRR